MALAVACLHMFAQSNWTGPPVSAHINDLLPPALLSSQVGNPLISPSCFCVMYHPVSTVECLCFIQPLSLLSPSEKALINILLDYLVNIVEHLATT